jgi:hypothetical protein
MKVKLDRSEIEPNSGEIYESELEINIELSSRQSKK